MSRHVVFSSLWTTVLLALLLSGCDSGPSGPDRPESGTPETGTATIAGRLTASVAAVPRLGAVTGRDLVVAGDDEFIGSRGVGLVRVTVSGSSGAELSSTETDVEGSFTVSTTAGTRTIEIDLGQGTTFAFTTDVDDGQNLFTHGKVEVGPVGALEMNVEIVRDDDGDGAADDEFAIRITGMQANQPNSGQVDVADPASEDGGPATADDFFNQQRVRVRGTWNGTEVEAVRVAGNCGRNAQPLELVGAVEALDETSLTLLGRVVEVDESTRFVGRIRDFDDLEVGDRVVVRVEREGADLTAIRVNGNGRARNGDEVVGPIDEVAESGDSMTVLGVDVLLEEAFLTSGDGCRAEEEENEEEENEEEENEEEGPATFEDLEDGQLAVVVQGSFEGDALEANHVVASSTSERQSAEIFGEVQSVDAMARQVAVMGVVFDVAPDARISGRVRSLDTLAAGMRIKLTLEDGVSPEVTALNVIGGGGPDMIMGGEMSAVDDGTRTFEVFGVTVHVTDDAVVNVE